MQRRLEELRYWVGPTDGSYGTLTEQAVYAFQKVNGLAIDGVVGPDTRAALANPAPPSPQSTAGLVWEVDKSRQVVMAVQDSEVLWIWNTSTGTEQPYTFEGRQLLADTPHGQHTIDWQVDGWRDGALGRMWRPKYFHPDGIAIHGYGSVPPFPPRRMAACGSPLQPWTTSGVRTWRPSVRRCGSTVSRRSDRSPVAPLAGAWLVHRIVRGSWRC